MPSNQPEDHRTAASDKTPKPLYDPWREQYVSPPRMPAREQSLAELFHEIAPDIGAQDIPAALSRMWTILGARRIPCEDLRASITGTADHGLFGQDLKLLVTSDEPQRLAHLWKESQRFNPVDSDDVRKLAFVEYYSSRGARVFADEEATLWSIQFQVQQGPQRGYLSQEERSFLNNFWNYRHEFRATIDFADLGLEWRMREGRPEPSLAESRFRSATFPQLSSHYFAACIQEAEKKPPEFPKPGPSEDFVDGTREYIRYVHLLYAERLRILREARRLSLLRERGGVQSTAAEKGWDRFLRHDLYRQYPPHRWLKL